MASWGYETLLGVADFAAATLAGWGNIGTTLTILATERGTERFLQVLDQGGTIEQAFWSGVTTGALDRILNKLPVEKLLGKSSGKVRQTLWKTMKEQGLLQMGSEAAGRVTDIVADTVVMGEQSEYKRLEAQYLKQGLNRKEARRQTLLDLAGSVAVSGGSGLVQGAALGSVAQLARRLFQMGKSGAEIEQEQPVQYMDPEPGSPEDNVRDLYAYYRKQAQIDSAAKDGIMEAESPVNRENFNSNETQSIPWSSWKNYPKIIKNGRQYAKVGDRLYSKHAVDRMQPSGNRFGPYIYQDGDVYGRSVAPQFVEDVIQSTQPVLQKNGNLAYISGNIKIIINQEGAVVTIVTFK